MLSYIGNTSGSSGCEIYGVRCNDVANMSQRHIFQFPPMRETTDCVSSGRLREVKNNGNFKQSSLKVVAYERWSPREVPSIVI